MIVETVEKKVKPDVVITLSWENAEQLHSMLYEAKSYAADCGEATDTHTEFLITLGRVLNEDW